MPTTATTGGSSTVSVISAARTSASLTLTVSPGSPSYSTWICWSFLRQRTGDQPRVMSEQWDPSCWLWSDAWCQLTRINHGVNLHDSHAGSINICYLDGHVKFQGGPAQLVWR